MSDTRLITAEHVITAPSPPAVVPGRRPVRSKPRSQSRARWLIAVGSVTTFLIIWQLAAWFELISVRYMSSPVGVFEAGVDLVVSGKLADNTLASLSVFVTGFLIAVVVGVPLGILMGWRLRIRQTFEPLITTIYLTPSLVLLPLFVLALGIGFASKVAIVFLEVVITIIVNTMAGIRETDPKLTRTARSFGASDWQVFRHVLLPSSLPNILTGLRLGVGRGILTVIMAELYGGVAGIGVLISDYGRTYQTSYLLFLTILVGVFGYAISTFLSAQEKRISPWKA